MKVLLLSIALVYALSLAIILPAWSQEPNYQYLMSAPMQMIAQQHLPGSRVLSYLRSFYCVDTPSGMTMYGRMDHMDVYGVVRYVDVTLYTDSKAHILDFNVQPEAKSLIDKHSTSYGSIIEGW